MQELITVLMSTYNETEGDLRKSIDSILQQSYRHTEFLIINDNPTNEMLARVLEEYQNRDPRVRVIKNDKNMGLVASLNRGWRLASGEYIARMDADDIALPDRLEKQMVFLREKGYDFVGAGIQHIDEKGDIISPLFLFPQTPGEIRKVTKKTDCVPHPTWLIKKSVMEALDGYRDIPCCEDYDFVLRAQQKGFLLGNLQVLGLYYRVRSTGLSKSNWARQTLTTEFLSKNWERADSCTMAEIEAYMQTKQAKRHAAFLNCQAENSALPIPGRQKAIRLFCQCWHNHHFWKYVFLRIRCAFTGKQ